MLTKPRNARQILNKPSSLEKTIYSRPTLTSHQDNLIHLNIRPVFSLSPHIRKPDQLFPKHETIASLAKHLKSALPQKSREEHTVAYNIGYYCLVGDKTELRLLLLLLQKRGYVKLDRKQVWLLV